MAKNKKPVDAAALTRVAYDARKAALWARSVRDNLADLLGSGHDAVEAADEMLKWAAEAAGLAADAVELRTGKRPGIDADDLREELAERSQPEDRNLGMAMRERKGRRS